MVYARREQFDLDLPQTEFLKHIEAEFAPLAESMRRVNRLARLMTVLQARGREMCVVDRRWLVELGPKAKGE